MFIYSGIRKDKKLPLDRNPFIEEFSALSYRFPQVRTEQILYIFVRNLFIVILFLSVENEFNKKQSE